MSEPLTLQQRLDITEIVSALKRVEWSGSIEECSVCRRPKAYGHPCSCPVKLALVKIAPRLLGHVPEPPRIGGLTDAALEELLDLQLEGVLFPLDAVRVRIRLRAACLVAAQMAVEGLTPVSTETPA